MMQMYSSWCGRRWSTLIVLQLPDSVNERKYEDTVVKRTQFQKAETNINDTLSGWDYKGFRAQYDILLDFSQKTPQIHCNINH